MLSILALYKWKNLPINYGETALLIMAVFSAISIARRGRKTVHLCLFPYYFTWFIISAILFATMKEHDPADFTGKWLRLALFVYIIDICGPDEFDWMTILKWLLRGGMFASVLLLVQVVMDHVFNYAFVPYIRSGLTLTYMPANELTAIMRERQALGNWRYPSIFGEPAHFAEYALLPLIVVLFSEYPFKTVKRKWVCAAVISLAIVFSSSANGVILLAIVWSIWTLRQLHLRPTRRLIMNLVFFGVVAIAVVIASGVLSFVFENFMGIFASEGTSGSVRVLQGLAIYIQIPPLNKIIGLGYGCVEAYLTANRIVTIYAKEIGWEWMNAFSVALVSSGALGFIAYIYCIYKMWAENSHPAKRVALITICILFCTSGLTYSCILVEYFVFVRCSINDFHDVDRNA